MSKSIRGTTKSKRRRGPGRPATTGKGVQIGIRWRPALVVRIDAWRGEQEDEPSRSEAIHRLVERGLERE